MPQRTWTDAEIGEQQQRVNNAAPNAVFYERGRLDCMKGEVIPPCDTTTIERQQWECGWADEYRGDPNPIVEQERG